MILKILITRFDSEAQKCVKIAMVSWLLKVFTIIMVSTESNILFTTENNAFLLLISVALCFVVLVELQQRLIDDQ